MQTEAQFENHLHKAQAMTNKLEQRKLLGQLAVELIDASIAKKIDWRVVNNYARKMLPLKEDGDRMMMELICDMEHWDDYTRDHGGFARTRQLAYDISKGVFYEELTTAMVYYVELVRGKPIRGVSYLAWEDGGKLRTRVTNSLADTLNPILEKSKNIHQFVESLPAKIGELELFGEPEIGPRFRFDIDN